MKLRSIELVLPQARAAAAFLTDIWGMAHAETVGSTHYLRGSGTFPYLVALEEGPRPFVRSTTFVCMRRELDELAARMAILEGAQRRAFQRVGLVRYNPFEETGGNQSFALALLDAAGDGWVLSSLHARSGTRVYAKAITAGRSDATLSGEETDAVQQALV